jgi:redox-sensitive bicupin YhaK (pirin superfamily)
MLQLRTNETLDGGDHGWLKARHHFAVSTNGNPANGSLGALVVWNDDEIAPGTGFGRHPHADMEIITYVRQGVVTHEDSAKVLLSPEGVRRGDAVSIRLARGGMRAIVEESHGVEKQ